MVVEVSEGCGVVEDYSSNVYEESTGCPIQCDSVGNVW